VDMKKRQCKKKKSKGQEEKKVTKRGFGPGGKKMKGGDQGKRVHNEN